MQLVNPSVRGGSDSADAPSVAGAAPLVDGAVATGALNILPLTDPVSRTDVAAEAIKMAILRGDFGAGEPLVERELASLLGVSKTPVREALKLLSRSGLVTISAYRGAFVQTVDAGFARSIYEVRMLLEPAAVRLATPHQDETTLDAAASALEDARTAGNAGDYATLGLANRRFHRALYERCGNPTLVDLLGDLQDKVALISVVGWSQRSSSSWLIEAKEHKKLLALVRTGKSEAAERALHDHIGRFISKFIHADELPEQRETRR